MIVCFSLLMSGVAVSLQAQDLPAYKRIVKELSSARYQGRGYAKNGVRKAGRFIEKEFRKAGADEVITQPFCLDVNTFPGVMKMSVDGKRLVAGQDFVLREFSPGIHDECKLYHVDTLRYDSEWLFADLEKPENKGMAMKSCIIVKRGRGKIVSGVVNLVHNIRYAQIIPLAKLISSYLCSWLLLFRK